MGIKIFKKRTKFFIKKTYILLSIFGCFLLLNYSFSSFEKEHNNFFKINHPSNNLPTKAKIALGKKLFFDPILSKDSTKSCSSCHIPKFAFSDTLLVSFGIEKRKGKRNTPSILNVGLQPYLLLDGGVPTLEMQILVPIQEHSEFDFNIVKVAERMQKDTFYVNACKEIFNRSPDPFCITRAIACYERTLVSKNSKYDNFYISKDSSIFSKDELAGMNLFYSKKTKCSVCHSGLNFTNYKMYNIGLYKNYPDSGRMRITEKETDRGKFKVPSLRNVAITAPYMHDGSLKTLNEVVEHFNMGGYKHKNKAKEIKKLRLSELEKQQLIAFLHTLTDESFSK